MRLRGPSENFLLFLVSLFSPLVCFCSYFPFLSFLFPSPFSSKPRSNLRGSATFYPTSPLPIRHIQLKSPRAIVELNFELITNRTTKTELETLEETGDP